MNLNKVLEGQVEEGKNENSEGEHFGKKTGNIMVNYRL